jgi:hypothetical protein
MEYGPEDFTHPRTKMHKPKPKPPLTVADILGVDNSFVDFLAMAKSNKALYDAHVESGFDSEQAMAVVLQVISTHLQTHMIIVAGNDADGTD